jgi:hypothetical protein
MTCWVSRETVMTWPMRRRMYFGVVGAVGVVDDAGAGVGGDAVLVDHPFEGGKCQIGNVLLFLSYFPVFQSPSANIKRRYEAYRFGAMCRRGWPGVGV